MTHAERLKLLQEWHERGLSIESATESFRKATGADDIERSPILRAAWKLWDCYTSLVAKDIGAECSGMDDWLTWWWYDNDGGRRGMDAKASAWTELRPIRTLEDLCELIEADLEDANPL